MKTETLGGIWRLIVPVLAAMAGGCGAEPATGEGEPSASSQHPIRNGVEIPEVNSGVVELSTRCTGTLLRNRWVLTAAHCIDLHIDRDFPVAQGGHFMGAPGTAVRAAKVDGSGRLVFAGSAQGRFYMKRFTSAGQVDTDFGFGSDLVTDLLDSNDESIEDFAFQADGRIVAVGWATIAGVRKFALTRYETDGSLDTSFGFLGAMLTDFAGGASQAFGVTIDGADRAVVVGSAAEAGAGRFALARYVDGLLDPDFDGDGRVLTAFPPQVFAQANDVAIDGSGRIVATGFTFGTEGVAAAVARYDAGGDLDPSFAGDGTVKLQFGSTLATVLKIQGTKILIGGAAGNGALVWRLNDDGSSDSGFGLFGASQVTFFRQQSAQVVGMAFASDGRIRLGVDVIDTTGLRLPGYAVVSANGVGFTDRVFPEHHGMVLPGEPGTVASALATAGDRVFVAGTRTADGRATFVVTQPDRTVDTDFTDFGFGVGVSMAGDDFIVADQAFLAPNNDDVAVLRLQTGVLMNGSRTGFTFAGFHPNPPSLVGSDVTCRGYGNNVVDASGNQTGFGTLRTGTSRVFSVSGRYLDLGFVPSAPESQQQVPLRGDSGSSCTFNGLLTGVGSRGSNVSAHQIDAARFAAWANTLIQTP